MEIFWNKNNNKYPLTNDEILLNYKFTNVYRSLDRVSQYLIKNIINKENKYSKKDLIFRIILFKIFNKIETWELLEKKFGDLKTKSFNYKKFSTFLDSIIKEKPIFSAAYIMTGSCSQYKNIGNSKHKKWLKLLDDYFIKGNVSDKILNAKSMEEVFLILKELPMIGNFLAYQYTIDLNYSKIINFSENDFVIAGPGAIRGIVKTFDNYNNYEDVIKYIHKNFNKLIKKYGFEKKFKPLSTRKPTLIDLQNVFCETDKYLREKKPKLSIGNKRIKQKYKKNIKKEKIDYVFPVKWKIEI